MSIRISDLPIASTLTGSELVPILQDGITKAMGTNQLLQLSSSASNVSFTPVGGVTSTNVQEAIGELDSKKAPLESPTFTGTVSGLDKSMVGLSEVDNTSDLNKPVSTAQQSALDLKADSANPTFTGIISGITKSDVGLGNVDNTSDVNKPVSTDQQAALNLKADIAGPTFTGNVSGLGIATGTSFNSLEGLSVTIPSMDSVAAIGVGVTAARGDHVHPTDTSRAPTANPTFTGTVSGVTKTMVGLGNVDNTSDANKPVSTAQQTALNLKVSKTSDTGTAIIPAGTDAQRDASPAVGAIRYSSTSIGWEGWNGTNWVSLGGGQMLGNALIKAISYNAQTISENLTVVTGTNAMSTGPVSISPGNAVTIEPGAVWKII